MALNLSNTVTAFLKDNPEQKYTARQIAEWIFEIYPDECRAKQERSKATKNPLDSDSELLQQIIREISAQRPRLQKNNANIKTTEGRPRKYYYTEQSDADEVEEFEEKNVLTQAIPLEHDLYPMLIEYLNTEHGLHAKRIDEKRSTNNRGPKGNEWLYPDLVALEDLASEWSGKVTECAQAIRRQKSQAMEF
jgi:hypothetical protein